MEQSANAVEETQVLSNVFKDKVILPSSLWGSGYPERQPICFKDEVEFDFVGPPGLDRAPREFTRPVRFSEQPFNIAGKHADPQAAVILPCNARGQARKPEQHSESCQPQQAHPSDTRL
jgi:hypothetical protein